MDKIFDFLNVNRVEIDFQTQHMVGGWQWENDKIKSLMMKKNLIRSFFKLLIPFKGFRKSIRKRIQMTFTSQVQEISKDDREMLREFYKEDVKHLSVLLERDLNCWTE